MTAKDGSETEHEEPLYYLRRAIEKADGDEEDTLRAAHQLIVSARSAGSEGRRSEEYLVCTADYLKKTNMDLIEEGVEIVRKVGRETILIRATQGELDRVRKLDSVDRVEPNAGDVTLCDNDE